MDFHQMLAFERGEEAGDRLARYADHVPNFLVRQSQRYTNWAVILTAHLTVLRREIQQEPRQLFRGGTRKPEIADLLKGAVINIAENLGHSQGGFAMLPEKLQKQVSGNEIGLDVFEGFGGDFVGPSGNCTRQATTSPGLTIRRISDFPSAEPAVSFARPLRRINTPRGSWPSTKRVAPLG